MGVHLIQVSLYSKVVTTGKLHHFILNEACIPCRRMMFSRVTSFKWMFQTAVFGFPSLGILLRHRKERELASKKRN